MSNRRPSDPAWNDCAEACRRALSVFSTAERAALNQADEIMRVKLLAMNGSSTTDDVIAARTAARQFYHPIHEAAWEAMQAEIDRAADELARRTGVPVSQEEHAPWYWAMLS